uniref:NADH dehydrogenase [ubiquinone] 1 alpha subcomplex subunit 3 n=1 Tax=Callorhinchus milii TaxID=7868 RepID=V9LL28_CALMI
MDRQECEKGEREMAAFINFLRVSWAKEPVIVAASGIAAFAVLFPVFSPYTTLQGKINRATPYTYPVPLRDDGSCPDVPTHPSEPKGPDLRWLKAF